MSYTDKVIDHFQNPRNVGELPNADGIGRVGNPSCGDIMEMYIKIEDGVIVQCTFKTFGCAAAIATSSMTTELVIGKTIEEAELMTKSDVAESLGGLPKVKMHCSNLATDALRAAIAHYRCKSSGNCKDLAKMDLSEACDTDHHHDEEDHDEDLG